MENLRNKLGESNQGTNEMDNLLRELEDNSEFTKLNNSISNISNEILNIYNRMKLVSPGDCYPHYFNRTGNYEQDGTYFYHIIGRNPNETVYYRQDGIIVLENGDNNIEIKWDLKNGISSQDDYKVSIYRRHEGSNDYNKTELTSVPVHKVLKFLQMAEKVINEYGKKMDESKIQELENNL